MLDLDLSLWALAHYLAVGWLLWLLAVGVRVVGDHWEPHSPVARRAQAFAWALVLVGASAVQLGVVIEMVWRGIHG